MEKQKREMMKDRAIERWLNLSSSSKGTERVYLFYIRRFCNTFGINTKQIMKEWDEVKHNPARAFLSKLIYLENIVLLFISSIAIIIVIFLLYHISKR